MSPVPRPCLDCGALTTNQSRCPRHTRARNRTRRSPAYDDPEYRRHRRQMIKDHIAQHGWVCPGAPDLDHEAHPCTTLTIDHIVPRSRGGTNSRTNLRVLCETENKRRGAG